MHTIASRWRALLAVGACIASATAQFHVAVTGNDANSGTAGSPFRTIAHAALVAPAGSIIRVHAGTYGDEQGIVQLGTKALVVEGDGAATTILRPHSTATQNLPLVTGGPLVVAAQRVGIVVAGTAAVQIRNLTIDVQRAVAPSGHVVGIHVQGGADVLVDRCVIVGCRPTSFATSGVSTAVAVRGDVPTDPTTCLLRSVVLRDCGTQGAAAALAASLEVQDCTIAGAGSELPAIDQSGVAGFAGAAIAVRHSRLGAFAGTDGAAIRGRGQGVTALEGNRIGGAAYGIDLQQTPPAIVAGSIRGNHVDAELSALRLRGQSGLIVESNGLCTPTAHDAATVFDDTAGGNLWNQNRYDVAPGTAAVAIAGGSNVDAAPLPGIADFDGPTRIACGGGPVAMCTADFDNDGRLDFATLDLAAPSVGITIARRLASGFTTQTIAFGGPGRRPIAIVAGEFDGAPGADLIALTADLPPLVVGAAFWVFRNNGAGSLSLLHQEPLPTFVNPTGIAQASFNGNAVGDLVITDQGAPPFTVGRGVTFLNDGTGTLWFATPLPAVFTGALQSCATGDLDGDNKIDVAVTEGSATSGRVHWFRGNGIGFFTAAPGSPLPLAAGPAGVAITDFDRDGDRDLLATAANGPLPLQAGQLAIFANNGGVLVPQAPLATGWGPSRIVAADIDQDGLDGIVRPELLVLDAPARSVRLFGARDPRTGFVGGGAITIADGPTDIAVGDFDGDAYPDLLATEPSRLGVALLRGVASIQVTTYGEGCPGTGSLTPRLEVRGAPALPTQPNVTLQIGLADGFPLTFAAIALSAAPAPVMVPCGPMIASLDELWIITTDAFGRSAINVPLPVSPDFRGIFVFFQGGVIDAAAATSVVPGLSLTAGLFVRAGV